MTASRETRVVQDRGIQGLGVQELRIHEYGQSAVLVDLPDLAAVRALDRTLAASPPPGTVDVVPAARTVLVRVRSGTDLAAVTAWVRRVWDDAGTADGTADGTASRTVPEAAGPTRIVEIGVHYDGADLAEVAARTGLTVPQVVARHAASVCTVAFGGFVPGFAYLVGLDPALHVARRAVPRERVPAGSVAVAGELTAVYPSATPGGWQLLGRTDVVMFDPDRDPPALLAPGTQVRFVDLGTAG